MFTKMIEVRDSGTTIAALAILMASTDARNRPEAYELMLAALKTAERFVKAERDTREKSYLPDPTDSERLDLMECLEAQEIIQRAIVAGELSR